MAGLASALAQQGYKVFYVAEQELSSDRVKLGWYAPRMNGVRLLLLSKKIGVDHLVSGASNQSVHICQGIRGSAYISKVRRVITQRGLRQWVGMETVDDTGAIGIIKRYEYARVLRNKGTSMEGILAIGYTTADWIKALGMPADRVYPFAYFLPDADLREPIKQREPGPFRFLFVGQFIRRKRLEILINSLQILLDRKFELLVVGSGTLENKLRMFAETALSDHVRWLGGRPMSEVQSIMKQVDCLVLPSRHDGWGAVVSEALMVGTPVICSDGCGAAGVVKCSGFGGVFPHNQIDVLQAMLDEQLQTGPIDPEDRKGLSSWAKALGAEAGARYLIDILSYAANGGVRPVPPWQNRVT